LKRNNRSICGAGATRSNPDPLESLQYRLFAFFSLATQRKESGCRTTPGLVLRNVTALDIENQCNKDEV